MNEHTKTVLDALSLVTVIAALATWLPPLAALASLVWSCLRIWESKTVQGWLAQWRQK